VKVLKAAKVLKGGTRLLQRKGNHYKKGVGCERKKVPLKKKVLQRRGGEGGA